MIFLIGVLLPPSGIALEQVRASEWSGHDTVVEQARTHNAPASTLMPAGIQATLLANIMNAPGSPAPEATSTPEWVWNAPGDVVVPILLFHHVAQRTPQSRYFVTPKNFEAQMRSLQEWGYTSIPLSMLVKAITAGAYLPPRPVVITFDDGNQDVYTNAFPIMRHYGFAGVVFVVYRQIGVGKFLDQIALLELSEAGWEIGNHSWSHTSLRSGEASLNKEIVDSRSAIEQMLGTPVEIFAYPFGLTSKYVTNLVKDAGYMAAVGLGTSYRHSEKSLFYLSRIEVRSDYDLGTIAEMLPWAGEINDGWMQDDLERYETHENPRGMERE